MQNLADRETDTNNVCLWHMRTKARQQWAHYPKVMQGTMGHVYTQNYLALLSITIRLQD